MIRTNTDVPQRRTSKTISRIGKSIKNSPKFVRKVFGKVKNAIDIGKNADHSQLKNCRANGWLYEDEDIMKGINYKVKYLGSVEVEYDPKSTSNNQEAAQKAMRALYAHSKNSGVKNNSLALSISVDRISLTDLAGTKITMRHSTTRIAYSTVDVQKPKVFAYVAVVKNTNLALCHVFSTKSAKQGYEMTFVCAQAFDTNFRRWQSDSTTAKKIASETERSDVEPNQAWQKKKNPNTQAPAPAPAPAPSEDKPPVQKEAFTEEEKKSPLKPGMKVFLAIQEGQNPADLAANYFKSLGIEMVEDEDDFGDFSKAVLRSESDAGQLQLGVDPEDYNATSAESGGYMTVGNFDFSDEEDDNSDNDEL